MGQSAAQGTADIHNSRAGNSCLYQLSVGVCVDSMPTVRRR